MSNINKNLEKLNEIWKSDALDDFIRRMLIYFDPLDLIVMGAPYNEYDPDIPKIKKLIIQKGVTLKMLSDFIFDLYKSNEGNINDVKSKSLRMAEDLIGLKNS